MSASNRIFVDSSVLLYLYSADEPEKKSRAEATFVRGHSYTSTQTLSELCTTLRSSFNLSFSSIHEVVCELRSLFHIVTVSADTVERGLSIAKIYHYEFYDSIVIATALETRCDVLYSQHLNSGQRIEKRLRIHNPLVGVSRPVPQSSV